MRAFELTKHAKKRMRLRGLSVSDINCILENGVEIKDSICMTDRYCRCLIDTYKNKIKMIERLRGKAVIVDGKAVITTFHMNKYKFKSISKG